MEQTAIIIGWKLALALIAGIPILTTIGVFVLARFTSVFDAYAGERMKLLAQFHNLDNLVEQTRALTATTETIKARVSDEMWDRQIRWSYKRDVYTRLLESVGELRTGTVRHKRLVQLRRTRNLSDPQYELQFSQEEQKTSDDFREASIKLLRACDVAPLVVSAEAYRILACITNSTRQVDFNSSTWEAQMEENISKLQLGLTRLQDAAREDLGYGQGLTAGIAAEDLSTSA